jgi:hypothetical protein
MLTDVDADRTTPRMRVYLDVRHYERSFEFGFESKTDAAVEKERVARPKFNPLQSNDEG